MIYLTKTCAIPSLPGSHSEVPQPTDTILAPCTTLPEFQAISFIKPGSGESYAHRWHSCQLPRVLPAVLLLS